MIKLLELFGGIGSPRCALRNIGVQVKSIDYVEILPYAVKAYNSMFDNNYTTQDIRNWNMNIDILIHGSPCQDFSKAGLNNILTGRSILYERTLEIVEKELNKLPKVIIWENVPNLISKRHIEHFKHYIETLENLGYKNSYAILNASKYGVPQARERLYTISTLDLEFKFPEQRKYEYDLTKFIDINTSFDDYKLSDNELSLFFYKDNHLCVKEATKRGYKEVDEFDFINVEYPTSKTRRGRVGKGVCQTITTSPRIAIYYNKKLRVLSSLEHWLLMGFDKEDYFNIKSIGITDRQISSLAGNSICVPVLEKIIDSILNVMKDREE